MASYQNGLAIARLKASSKFYSIRLEYAIFSVKLHFNIDCD